MAMGKTVLDKVEPRRLLLKKVNQLILDLFIFVLSFLLSSASRVCPPEPI